MDERNRKMDERNIEVRPSTLRNLVSDVASGAYRIPQFQREFVWKKSKVVKLLDSISKEFPIGSFFIWKAGRGNNDLFRHSVELGVPPVKADDDVSFILDGQQRITSLYVTLKGMTVGNTNYGYICFDMERKRFMHRSTGPDNNRYVSVSTIWGPEAMTLIRKIDEQYADGYARLFKTLNTYPISIVEVKDKTLPQVCKIFQRINQAGKRLDRFDLISAMTFTKDFDLREKLKQDVQNVLKERGFGEISPIIITQLMALLKTGRCTERNEYDLSSSDITGMWKSVVESVLLAADALRKTFGVLGVTYLPYDALLTLLSYSFAKSRQRSMTADQMNWIKTWFWRASFGERYGAGGATRIGRDRELFDGMLRGEMEAPQIPVNLTTGRLAATKMTWPRSALRNAVLCLLATRNPLHLLNNTPLNLLDGSISDFTSVEKHHVFPHAFLRDQGQHEAMAHAVPNFCFLPSDLNKWISNRQPSDYFEDLRSRNQNLGEALQAQLLPSDDDFCLQNDDYLAFLQIRGADLLSEILRLCGLSSSPRSEERHSTIESIEHRLRDRIHAILQTRAEGDYWKHAIPEDIRQSSLNRIIAQSDHRSIGEARRTEGAVTLYS